MKKVERTRWITYAVFAVMFFAAAISFPFIDASIEEAKATALSRGMPAPVSLDQFDPDQDIHPADEITVTGWIETRYNYELTETRRRGLRSSDTVRRMFVLFGPGDGDTSKEARAVLTVAPEQVEAYMDALARTAKVDHGRVVFTINGQADGSPDLKAMIDDAMVEQGLTKAANFTYIAPWTDGREAALRPGDPQAAQIAMGIAVLVGLVLLALAWRARRAWKRYVAWRNELPDHVLAELERQEKRERWINAAKGVAVIAAIGALYFASQRPDILPYSYVIGALVVIGIASKFLPLKRA